MNEIAFYLPRTVHFSRIYLLYSQGKLLKAQANNLTVRRSAFLSDSFYFNFAMKYYSSNQRVRPGSNVEFHVPNLIQISKNNSFFSFALSWAHVKFDV